MTKQIIFVATLICTSQIIFCQEEIKGNYLIFLNKDQKSANSNVPIILEQEQSKIEILYTIDGKHAAKKSKEFVPINKNFSFNLLGGKLREKSISVDLLHVGDKLIIKPKNHIQKNFEQYSSGKNQRLVIDVSNGVEIIKTAYKVNALTVPIKIFLSSKSDSLANFTNNVESAANIAITVGKTLDRYLYKGGEQPKLTNTHNLFVLYGQNKLELKKKHTDGINNGDNVLSMSGGVGYQYGYGKLGLSLLLGIDFPFSSIGKNWVFKKQPWLGLGVGYSILSKTLNLINK